MRLPPATVRVAWCLAAWGVAGPAAAEAVRSPVAPRESLRHIVLEPGLTAELAACEPDVIDPVALRFDEDGRMWVVQMRDYPTADTPGIHARSRISRLEDTDGDGFFETATVFADDLPYATGLQPWRGGVFVTLAGRVAYLEDTTGDGRADVDETWYRGFAEDNTQLRANHPTLAIDNHIYVANGLRGGAIVDARAGAEAPADRRPVSISGMDFRFDPRTGACAAVSGVGQFGLTFDDHGNRFVCTNRNPAIHVVLEDRFLRRNPLVAVSAVSADVASWGADSRVFPIARSWTTSHLHAGQFTAACGVHVYRGDALPAGYRGNILVCEPTGHLVHREVLQPSGVTFSSAPPGRPEGGAAAPREFLASRDEWCTPVSLTDGPDGAVYVVDMYRAVIEHPQWMPDELRRRPDLALGNDRGRIYRIVPTGTVRRAVPRLSTVPSDELVALLGHPNAWQRESAARLLLERADMAIVPALERMAAGDGPGQARIHALRLLEGLGAVREEILAALLDDSDPRLVEQAILVAEPRCADSARVRAAVSRLGGHPDARVRFQALLVAAPLPSPPARATDRWELEAMLLATGDRGGTVLESFLRDEQAVAAHVAAPGKFIAELARLAAASAAADQRRIAVESLAASAEYGLVGLTGFLTGAASRGESLDAVRAGLGAAARRSLDGALLRARAVASDPDRPEPQRGAAIDLLAFEDGGSDLLAAIAVDDPDTAVRLRAIAALARGGPHLDHWRLLLGRFRGETPAIQAAIQDGLWSDPDRTGLLLDEIASGRMTPAAVDPARVRRLLGHRSPAIRERAATLFASAVPADRERALAEYRSVPSLEPDPSRGRAVFATHCASCHRIADVGTPFAPDISDAREKSVSQLLTDIIQPNRAIDANYFSYTAVTVEGVVHTGVLAAETSTSVTLRQAAGKEITLRRDDIEELRSDGVSFMPEGLERSIPPQEMADLIGFIKQWRYLDRSAAP